MSDCIEKEDDRVDFLTVTAQALASKAKIKLNTKRLYAADGRAVTTTRSRASASARSAASHSAWPTAAQASRSPKASLMACNDAVSSRFSA